MPEPELTDVKPPEPAVESQPETPKKTPEQSFQEMGEELRAMREERDALRAQLEAHPARSPAEGRPAIRSPKLEAIEDRLGLERGELIGAVQADILAPVQQLIATQTGASIGILQQLKDEDPQFWGLYEADIRKELKNLPPEHRHLRGDEDYVRMVRDTVRGRHMPEITAHVASEVGSNPEIVGRFTEHAAGGRGGSHAGLTARERDEAISWGATEDDLRELAERKTRRRE